MKITEHQFNEIKQRLVAVKEEFKEIKDRILVYIDPQTFREEIAYLEGREVELTWIIELLESIKQAEKKAYEALSTNIH